MDTATIMDPERAQRAIIEAAHLGECSSAHYEALKAAVAAGVDAGRLLFIRRLALTGQISG